MIGAVLRRRSREPKPESESETLGLWKVGLPPGDVDPATVVAVRVGPGIIDGAALVVPVFVVGVPTQAVVEGSGSGAVQAIAIVVGLALGGAGIWGAHRWDVRAQARRWKAVAGVEPGGPLVIGLTPEHLVVWTVEGRSPVRWRTDLVWDRALVTATQRQSGTIAFSGPTGEVALDTAEHMHRPVLDGVRHALER